MAQHGTNAGGLSRLDGNSCEFKRTQLTQDNSVGTAKKTQVYNSLA